MHGSVTPHDGSVRKRLVNAAHVSESLHQNDKMMEEKEGTSTSTMFTNWAHIHSCTPEKVHYPTSAEEVAGIVRQVASRGGKESVRVWGSGHSPSDIACSDSHLIVMRENMSRLISVDKERRVVQVEGGMTLQQLNEMLPKYGLALANLGSISDQTIAGAISTGTHGTGWAFGILATTILELEIVVADGSIVQCSRQSNKDLFLASLCSMGTMGVITKITLQCVADYSLEAHQSAMSLTHILENLDTLNPKQLTLVQESGDVEEEEVVENGNGASGGRFRFWWFPHTQDDCIVWRAHKVSVDAVPTSANKTTLQIWIDYIRDMWIGFHLLQFLLFLSRFLPFLVPWINQFFFDIIYRPKRISVDKSYKVMNFNCLFKQYVNEWAIPVEHTQSALRDLKLLLDREPDLRVHFPVEVRFVKGDDIWLSPCYGRDSCFIGVIMYRPYGFTIAYEKYFAEFEKIMMRYSGRPHWAKEFTLTPAHFKAMYPKWDEFCALRQRYDPQGVFANEWVKRYFQ